MKLVCSTESQKDEPVFVPMEEITTLEPGQSIKRVIHVHFHHHLLPLKLTLWCNDQKHPVKLRPDIGYFIKPLIMNLDAFSQKEAQLPGMFEYTRRYLFVRLAFFYGRIAYPLVNFTNIFTNPKLNLHISQPLMINKNINFTHFDFFYLK